MYFFYLFSLLPILIFGILWYFNKKIEWREWLTASIVSLILAIFFNITAVIKINNKMQDVETWSGQIVRVKQYSKWKEYYQEAIYRTEYYYTTEYSTDSKGRRTSRRVQRSRRVFDHWEDRTRWHSEHWRMESNINTSYSIDKDYYLYLIKRFGKTESVPGDRTTGKHNSRMIDGDPNDYIGININNWVEPVTKLVSFENRIKAAPTIFQFVKVPTNIIVFDYPENKIFNKSDRLLGTANNYFSILKLEQINGILGPTKNVNLIVVGFTNLDRKISEYQQAKWIGGKKNDLIVVFGPNWAKCFGWTESELCKKNIESLFLNNEKNDKLLDLVAAEIKSNYKLVDWTKFDYIKIKPNNSIYIWFIGLNIVINLVLFFLFFNETFNEILDFCSRYRKYSSRVKMYGYRY